MLREEHMDVFGVESSGTYTYDQSVASAITGNILTIDPTIPHWRAQVFCTVAGAGGTSFVLTVQGANALSGGSLSGASTLMTKTVLLADLVKGAKLLDVIIPSGYKYIQISTGTVTGTFTAGKIGGNVQPEFN